MAQRQFLRREGYWPTNPVVGSRGERTRHRIVAQALKLFGERGFRGTSVDTIAQAAGTSRAALYQYFDSKEQIFIELLEECGGKIMRLAAQLGSLGPTSAGFGALKWWLGAYGWVYDQYATVFVEASRVDMSGTVRPMVLEFNRIYRHRIEQRLQQSGVSDPSWAALVLTSLANQFNYIRCADMVQLPAEDEAVDSLAVCLQLLLFPHTPIEAFETVAPTLPKRRRPAVTPLTPPLGDNPERRGRAAATMRRILDVACHQFAGRGYDGTSVDDIVAEAGVARATFYRHFDDKLDLLRRLSREAATADAELTDRLAAVDPTEAGVDALRQWLKDFVVFHRRYRAVIRLAVQGGTDDPELVDFYRHGVARTHLAARAVLERVPRGYPVNLDVASALFVAALDRLPDAIAESDGEVSPDCAADSLAAALRATLLNPGLDPEGC